MKCLKQYNTSTTKSQHRQRIVYVIEDAIYLAMCFGAIAIVCWVCGNAFRLLGVS